MAVNREMLAQRDADARAIVLDMDSSESPVHGAQEGSAYNGHFASVCYHPLFLFNEHGDCVAATLRPATTGSRNWQHASMAFRARRAPEIYDRATRLALSRSIAYQAKSWTTPDRTTAVTVPPRRLHRDEHDPAEPFGRPGTTSAGRSWIKEGKQATHWTRLSCLFQAEVACN